MYISHFSLQWCLSTAQAYIRTYVHSACICIYDWYVKCVGCCISGPTAVRKSVGSTFFRMYVHSKCTGLISGLTQCVPCTHPLRLHTTHYTLHTTTYSILPYTHRILYTIRVRTGSSLCPLPYIPSLGETRYFLPKVYEVVCRCQRTRCTS